MLVLQAEYMKELTEDHLPTTLKKLEVQAVQNGAENGWIVGQNVRKLSVICGSEIRPDVHLVVVTIVFDLYIKRSPHGHYQFYSILGDLC